MTATFCDQLEGLVSVIRKVQPTESLLTATRIPNGVSLKWSTSLGLSATSRFTSWRFSTEPNLQIVHVERNHPRETLCGDVSLVMYENGALLLAVVDGLGHGPLAHEAAKTAVRWLGVSVKQDLQDSVLTAHSHLASTRGTTLGIAKLDLPSKTVSATTVGNVRLGLYRNYSRVWSPCGCDAVLGHGKGGSSSRLDIRIESSPIPDGTLLLMFSDGINSQLRLPVVAKISLEELSLDLFTRHQVPSDDASLLIVSAG